MKNIRFLLLSTFIFIVSSSCFANFRVEPQHLNININQKTALLNVTNQGHNKVFTLEMHEAKSKRITTDLAFSPSTFTLLPGQTQVVRVMTKSGVIYGNKNYSLHIITDDDDPRTPVKPNIYKILISIGGVEKPEISEQLDQNNSSNNNDISGNSGGLSQMHMSVPVTTTVGP